ncbi:MAG: hypothetical protein H6740_21410 [Alphaproteobacteria bacterium]|nr:hypothetical protein [Alphaproteobacteria bacterium]
MSRDPLSLAILALALLNLPLSVYALQQSRAQHTTYVFTPLVDVVPGTTVLTEEEALRIREDLRTQVDARDMQQAYAALGSTMSLDDLVEGVAALEGSGHPLDAGQQAELREILQAGQASHQALWQVQDEILRLEAQLAQEVSAVIEALPEAERAAAEAAVSGLPEAGARGGPPERVKVGPIGGDGPRHGPAPRGPGGGQP